MIYNLSLSKFFLGQPKILLDYYGLDQVHMKSECITCGITESMRHANGEDKRNEEMDTLLRFIKK